MRNLPSTKQLSYTYAPRHCSYHAVPIVAVCRVFTGSGAERPRRRLRPPAAQADPDVQKFEHAVDVQATEWQTEKSHTMLSGTKLARQQASDLARLAASSNDSIELTHSATTLEDSVDQALTDYRSFRRSLSEQQELEEKSRMKKLSKAAHSISKDNDAMSQRLEQVAARPAKAGELG